MVARDRNTKRLNPLLNKRGSGPHKTKPAAVLKASRTVRKSSSLEIQAWFIQRGERGGTTDECAGSLGLMHHAVSAALNRLRRSGALQMTDERRATRSGHTAHVYVWAPNAKRSAAKPEPSRDQRILKVAKAFVAKRSGVSTDRQYARLVRTLIEGLSEIALKPV
jgi:predicted transcriptional regulator